MLDGHEIDRIWLNLISLCINLGGEASPHHRVCSNRLSGSRCGCLGIALLDHLWLRLRYITADDMHRGEAQTNAWRLMLSCIVHEGRTIDVEPCPTQLNERRGGPVSLKVRRLDQGCLRGDILYGNSCCLRRLILREVTVFERHKTLIECDDGASTDLSHVVHEGCIVCGELRGVNEANTGTLVRPIFLKMYIVFEE